MIQAFTSHEPLDHLGLYGAFLERETDSSGTAVLHHGRVKRPGKQVPDFKAVELKTLGSGAGDGQEPSFPARPGTAASRPARGSWTRSRRKSSSSSSSCRSGTGSGPLSGRSPGRKEKPT